MPATPRSRQSVIAEIARITGQTPQPLHVRRMVGTKAVARYMRLVATAQKSTRGMGLLVR